MTGSALARFCAVHVCVFATTFPGDASFGDSAYDNFCTLGQVTSRWEQVSRCPLTISLSLVVVEEVECYMLPVSAPLTGNELVECAAVAHYLKVGGNDSGTLHLPNITTRALSQLPSSERFTERFNILQMNFSGNLNMFRHKSHPYQDLQGGQDSKRMHSKLIPFDGQQYRTRHHIQ